MTVSVECRRSSPVPAAARRLRATLLACLGLLGAAAATGAEARGAALARPDGPVVLTVSGRVTQTNGSGVAAFDRAMLAALPAVVIETMTPWTDGLVRFEGPLVRDVLARAGATGREVLAVALNDYRVPIPVADFEAYEVILALRMNGQALRTRDRGPLWVIYPWTEHPELRTEVVYGRSIWQLYELIVRE